MSKLKRVSFKVAKAIKEAGYPQDETEYKYTKSGNVFVPKNRGEEEKYAVCDAPYVTDVWLWLWREKNIYIDIDADYEGRAYALIKSLPKIFGISKANYPEEAITKAIGYLVDNDLIK